MKVFSSFCIALLFGLTIVTPFASADNLATETITSTFNADSTFTDRGNGYVSEEAIVNVFNLTGNTEEVPLNIQSWPETNGTYSGAVFQESVLALDFISEEKFDVLPFSYVTIGSIHNWTSQDLMNGAVKTNVRLPWVGDYYDFMSMRVYKVDRNTGAVLGTQVTTNGTMPTVQGSNATLVYENYLNFDMWNYTAIDSPNDDEAFPTYYANFETSYLPDDLHNWPFRIDPIPGIYTENSIEGIPTDFPAPPYSWHERGSSYSMERIGDRYYADMNLFLEPDQNYYFTSSAIISSLEKPQLALSSESINGGGNNCTIIQGLYTEEEKQFEKFDEIPNVELGWSFLFQGGHGDGLTGLEIEGEHYQSIDFMAELEPREEGENFSFMLPIIPDNEDSFEYSVQILPFNSSGYSQAWEASLPSSGTIDPIHSDGSLYRTDDPNINNTLTSEGFILYSPRCEDTTNNELVPCVPAVGSKYYYIKIWLNHDPEKTPINFRVLGSTGTKGFLIADNNINHVLDDSATDQCSASSCLAFRAGGDYYAYNLTLFAQHHEGSWVQIDGNGKIINYFQSSQKKISKSIAFSTIAKQMDIVGSRGVVKVDLWEQAFQYWNEFDPKDPKTYGYLADAIMFTVSAVAKDLWIGTSSLIGTLQGAFTNTKDYLLELGSFVTLYLGEIKDVIINIVVQIYDYIVPLTEYMIALCGAWVFYFALRLILLVVSYIHISLKGAAFR